MLEIKKFKFAVEVHIDRKKSEDFKARKMIYTFTPKEWEELKKEMLNKSEINQNKA